LRYPELSVSGSPSEMGRQIGEGARDQIRGFCAIALERVRQTVAVSQSAADAIAAESIGWIERYAPEQLAEMHGMADAAGVTLADIVLLQIRNQLQPDDAGGCTSFSVVGESATGRVVAQNWDNDPALDPFTLVLTRRPTGQPAFTTLTQAGLIAYIGFNDAGLGMCLNTLPAPSRKVGVPHYCILRRMYETRSLDTAVATVRAAHRAIPANIMLCTPEGPADLEVTLEDIHILRDATLVTHTNHCLHPELLAINARFPELIQSRPRLARVNALLNTTSRAPDLHDIEAALRDHDGQPLSICRHANHDGPFGFWQTVFSVIIQPESQQMHITRGTPCDQPYQTYRMLR
jgi:isopenicillin-N N-acyltransferase-like protein